MKLNYVLRVLKDHELALEVLETCLLHHPENQRAHLDKALVLSWMNQHEEAQRYVGKLIHRWPASNDVFITASQVEKNAGNTDQQLRHINSMLSLSRMSPVVSLNPDGAITPEHLATATDEVVEDARPVSIIMTTYKRDPLLDAAISSILNQTYQNIELIIVDDCSPDDNFSYLQHLAESDERIRVFQMPENGGTYVAKNFGMTQARENSSDSWTVMTTRMLNVFNFRLPHWTLILRSWALPTIISELTSRQTLNSVALEPYEWHAFRC